MINIAICDDDAYVVGQLEHILLRTGKKMGMKFSVECYFTGAELLNDISRGYTFDIIYLDIEMQGLNGIETAKIIRNKDDIVILIYVTSYESYAKDLFSMKPFEFMLKPVNENTFIKIFENAVCELLKYKSYFDFKFNKSWYKVPVQSIIYFESKKRLVYLYTTQGTYKFYGKLNDIEKYFEKSKAIFWRIHQSYLVNYQFILKISYECILLMDGTELSISVERRKEISSRYFEQLRKKF